jgi:hypothetical protein
MFSDKSNKSTRKKSHHKNESKSKNRSNTVLGMILQVAFICLSHFLHFLVVGSMQTYCFKSAGNLTSCFFTLRPS